MFDLYHGWRNVCLEKGQEKSRKKDDKGTWNECLDLFNVEGIQGWAEERTQIMVWREGRGSERDVGQAGTMKPAVAGAALKQPRKPGGSNTAAARLQALLGSLMQGLFQRH